MNRERPTGHRLHRRRVISSVLASIAILSLLVLFLGPIIYALLVSLQPERLGLKPRPTWLFIPTLSNFTTLITKYHLGTEFINSVVTSTVSTVLALIIGIPGAYVLSRERFKGRRGILGGLMASRALPAVGVGVPFFIIFTDIHLINSPISLILVYLPYDLGLIAWLMTAYFASVPISLDEAAAVDGAGPLMTLWRVILPISRPGLITTAIFAFFFGWNNFFFPLILTEASSATITVGVTAFVGEFSVIWGEVMAGIVVLSAPVLIASFLLRKHMITGLGAGAVRG